MKGVYQDQSDATLVMLTLAGEQWAYEVLPRGDGSRHLAEDPLSRRG